MGSSSKCLSVCVIKTGSTKFFNIVLAVREKCLSSGSKADIDERIASSEIDCSAQTGSAIVELASWRNVEPGSRLRGKHCLYAASKRF
jgi:hypothetical protein